MGVRFFLISATKLARSPHLLWLFVLCACMACSQERATHHDHDAQAQAIPEEETASTADTLLARYWIGYNFHDESNLTNPDKGEQSLVNFINLFPSSSPDVVSRSIKTMLSQAQREPMALDFFMKQYEKYLYDPNSPMRNDVYYLPVMEFKLDSMRLEETEKIRTKSKLALLRKNLPGERAADFSYILPNGDRGRLSKLSSPLTVLFFYEPGCSHCEEAIQQLKDYPSINTAIDNKSLVFLAIYPFGGEDVWKEYQGNLPRNWINGFNEKDEVITKNLYDLKATPTIFLLDADKKVILKDTDVVQLLAYLGLR
ncbi:DUF5106 domain-containing protein [Sphingobacterium paludis]|uniref:Thioredoxin-like protein n=1 Tax=Sphingobacterium paludis TaxID=1476465 RepID=A0A4R7CYT3_9SPHI|nr:DUF5106 domain-containing protein [Sphingobacterium paludis]TDS13773.1 thioredoxin-like protein [Sphingobacterium paludis]